MVFQKCWLFLLVFVKFIQDFFFFKLNLHRLFSLMFIWNYSHSLKHFLKIRRELKARHWGNVLHKYGLGLLALDAILEVEASMHFITYKDSVTSWEDVWYWRVHDLNLCLLFWGSKSFCIGPREEHLHLFFQSCWMNLDFPNNSLRFVLHDGLLLLLSLLLVGTLSLFRIQAVCSISTYWI